MSANNNNNDKATNSALHKVWAPKPTEHCVLCVPDNEKKVCFYVFLMRVFSSSLSLKFPILMRAFIDNTFSLFLSLFNQRAANDDRSGEKSDQNGRFKTPPRRFRPRSVGRSLWFASRGVSFVHLRALGPTKVPEEDTDGNIQLVRRHCIF